MRFPLLPLALLSLATLTTACLRAMGSISDTGILGLHLDDKGQTKCFWKGAYRFGTQQYLNCISGFFSWINVPAPGPNGLNRGVMAYASNGLNLRFEVHGWRDSSNVGWLIASQQYCSTAQVATVEVEMSLDGDETELGFLEGGGESTTADVPIHTKAARPFSA